MKYINAVIKIQARVRAFLARKEFLLMNRNNFRVANLTEQRLSLFSRLVLNIGGIYFALFLYTDPSKEWLVLTLKEVSTKQAIVSQKYISVADFEEVQNLEELADQIIEVIANQGEQIVIDEQGNINEDWAKELREYIEN